MVSTRGVRYKFSEGERVLCYEPDPTKAKVLYDSKVLEVIESKDKRGRRTVEYLIHFQGWNSSWDRCVSEDFVLKDTEENRQLQRDLAEKSQLQLGAYLYRRERKKGGSTSGSAGTAKRARHGFSDDGGSSTSPPPDGTETNDTDSSSGEGSQYAPQPHLGRAHITLPTALRERLTFDYHVVVKRGRLTKLPAEPSVADILESFVKWYARAGAWHPQRGRHDPPHRPDLTEVSCRLNLVREVADGLRVYFDFVLRGHLLYRPEQAQYRDVCGRYIDSDDDVKSPDPKTEASMTAKDELIKSPKIPEYAHLPPDPVEPGRTGGVGRETKVTLGVSVPTPSPVPESAKAADEGIEANGVESGEPNVEGAAESAEPAPSAAPATASPAPATAPPVSSLAPSPVQTPASGSSPAAATAPTPAAAPPAKPKPVTRAAGLARRLRSHKSMASHPEAEEPTPSTSTGEPREALSSSVGSSASSVSENWARPATTPAAPPATRTLLSLLLDKVSKWELISREGTEHLPCRVYGAIHLARLFVKLPDFLGATQMPDFKLKLIIKHIDMFIQYLDEHGEWFGDSYYIADPIPRPH